MLEDVVVTEIAVTRPAYGNMLQPIVMGIPVTRTQSANPSCNAGKRHCHGRLRDCNCIRRFVVLIVMVIPVTSAMIANGILINIAAKQLLANILNKIIRQHVM